MKLRYIQRATPRNDYSIVSDRGKVVGGLPDVVTIMEKKVTSDVCDLPNVSKCAC